MEIERFGSGSPWEDVVGYSRAVRVGPLVLLSGTTATGEDGQVMGGASAYEQTRQALHNAQAALQRAGVTLADVIQTRIYVTDISRWEEVGRAHGEVFGDARPVASMVEVSRLIDPRMLVEIEVVAYDRRAGGRWPGMPG